MITRLIKLLMEISDDGLSASLLKRHKIYDGKAIFSTVEKVQNHHTRKKKKPFPFTIDLNLYY